MNRGTCGAVGAVGTAGGCLALGGGRRGARGLGEQDSRPRLPHGDPHTLTLHPGRPGTSRPAATTPPLCPSVHLPGLLPRSSRLRQSPGGSGALPLASAPSPADPEGRGSGEHVGRSQGQHLGPGTSLLPDAHPGQGGQQEAGPWLQGGGVRSGRGCAQRPLPGLGAGGWADGRSAMGRGGRQGCSEGVACRRASYYHPCSSRSH